MVMTQAEHNAPGYLAVQWRAFARGLGRREGWYVVRCCPCHFGVPVTLPYDDQERAERARRVILGEERPAGLTTPERGWTAPRAHRVIRVVAGQVWRRNRNRDCRHFQVLEVRGDRVRVCGVERSAAGDRWVRAAGRGVKRTILLRRLIERPKAANNAWPYTCVEGGSDG